MSKLSLVGRCLRKFESSPTFKELVLNDELPEDVLKEGFKYKILSNSDTVTGSMSIEFVGIYQGVTHKNEINSALEDASALSSIFHEDLVGYEEKLHNYLENVNDINYLTFLEESTKCIIIIDPSDNIKFMTNENE